MAEKKKIIFKPEYNAKVLILDGKKYRHVRTKTAKNGHTKAVEFEEMPEEQEFNHKIRVEKVVDYLIGETKLSARTILTNILLSQSIETIEKLEKKVDRKTKVKVGRGCLYLKMGNAEIPIID